MKLIIEARFEDSDGGSGPPIVVCEIERRDGNLDDLGLTLAQGRDLLGQVQSRLVSQQAQRWLEQHSRCRRCGQALAHKDTRYGLWKDCGGEPTLVVVPMRERRPAADLQSNEQGDHSSYDTGARMSSDQMGGPPALQTGELAAQGGFAAEPGHFLQHDSTPCPLSGPMPRSIGSTRHRSTTASRFRRL